MRYHYKKPDEYRAEHGKVHHCNHPLFSRCTLYSEGNVGLGVIQARFNPRLKTISWSEVDPWLVDDIYTNERFERYFKEHAKEPDENGVYPTFPVRQVMWALRMMPLRRQFWENY